MIKNNDSRNKAETYDLTRAELDFFYKGCGKTTVLLDKDNNILAAKYADGRGSEVFDAVIDYNDYHYGMFSNSQFIVLD